MVETLSLYLSIVGNDVKKEFSSHMKWHFMKHRELLELLTYLPWSLSYKLLKKVKLSRTPCTSLFKDEIKQFQKGPAIE